MIKVVPAEQDQIKGCHYCTNVCTEACTDACSIYITCMVCSDWDTCLDTYGPPPCQGDSCDPTADPCKCTNCTNNQCTQGTSVLCPKGASRALGLRGLKTLRAALSRRLEYLDREIEVREELARPRTLEEADALEKKLAEALEEVKKIKSELKKKPSK